MTTLHRTVFRLKHWQVFAIVTLATASIGYPLYLLGQHLFNWQMPFMDSPAPACVLYVFLGLWFDAVLSTGHTSHSRWLSIILLVLFSGAAFWLRKDRPSADFLMVLPLFALAIAWIIWVAVPAAKTVHTITGQQTTGVAYWLDVVLVACYFPFGLWIIQPRLNRARSVEG